MRTTANVLVSSLCIIALSACVRSPRTSTPETGTAVRTETRREVVALPDAGPGEISFRQFRAVIPRIRALRADPSRIELVVGQRIDLAHDLRVVALDSAGRELGRLMTFDQALDSPAAELDGPGGVRGVQPGEGVLIVEVSLFAQYGGQGSPPRLEIPIVVRR